jgi:general stress protein 26
MWQLRPLSRSLHSDHRAGGESPSVASLRRLLRGMSAGMLTTRSAGGMRTRPMMLRAIDAGGNLLFLADRRSPMVADLEVNAEVSIAFVDPSHDLYISISGVGALAADPEQIRPLWTWSYRTWYPQGWRDLNLVRVAVAVNEVEYWYDASAWRSRIARSFRAAVGRRSHLNQHGLLVVGAHHGPGT